MLDRVVLADGSGLDIPDQHRLAILLGDVWDKYKRLKESTETVSEYAARMKRKADANKFRADLLEEELAELKARLTEAK